MSLFSELKRRNVFRVAIAYVAASWIIIQVAETLFPVFGVANSYVRLVVLLLIIGFLPVVALAWIYEWTPEGIKLEGDLDRAATDSRHADKKLDRAIIVFLALAVGYFSLDKFVLEPARDAYRDEEVATRVRDETLKAAFATDSIVVLPFVNLSGGSDSEYFSDGISEELLNLLAKISRLRVISRSSAFSFKGADITLPDLAQKLNVSNILNGSVEKNEDQLTITAELIDARSNTTLWSETFDRSIDEVFEIQNEIAASVADKLDIVLPGQPPSAQETDTAAYNLFLQARYLANQFTPESLERAAALYNEALTIDPDYSRAWSGLGWVYANQTGSGHLAPEEALDLAREATWTALALEPNDARAYANVGWIALNYDNDLALAARHYSRALSLDPNGAGIVNGAAVLTEMLGRTDEAVVLHEYSIARDPVDANRHSNLAVAYITAGRYDDAIASIQTAITLSPQRIGAHYLKGLANLLNGDAQSALAAFERESDEEYRVKGRALAYHDLGQDSEAAAALLELREKWGGQWPSEVAQVYAWTGDTEAAIKWLDKAIEANESGINEQALSPLYYKIEADPRWHALIKQWGHSPEQLAAINFEIELPQ